MLIDFGRTYMKLKDLRVEQYVPYYLMMAYGYYELDAPIGTDAAFDKLAKLLKQHYEEIQHPHKSLITIDMLDAGTYIGEYPEMVKGGYYSLKQKLGRSLITC